MGEDIVEKIEKVINPVIEGEGFSVYDIEYDRKFLRIFIENPLGVSIDDCVRISKELSKVLDRANLIHHRYILEVSSPGLDRKLKRKEHYIKAVGKRIKVYVKGEEPRIGYLMGVDDMGILLKTEEGEVSINFESIKLSHVYVDTDELFGRRDAKNRK